MPTPLSRPLRFDGNRFIARATRSKPAVRAVAITVCARIAVLSCAAGVASWTKPRTMRATRRTRSCVVSSIFASAAVPASTGDCALNAVSLVLAYFSFNVTRRPTIPNALAGVGGASVADAPLSERRRGVVGEVGSEVLQPESSLVSTGTTALHGTRSRRNRAFAATSTPSVSISSTARF